MTRSSEDGLIWDDDKGYGFHPAKPMSYSGNYFAKYQALDNTAMGKALTGARTNLVSEYYHGNDIIDIGIGGGRFCTEMQCYGYDVSQEAVHWLNSLGIYRDPYHRKTDVLTFWDSLEHIVCPSAIVQQAKRWAFVSMPIYQSMEHCLSSKHYKPSEHLHYWTDQGLIDWFAEQGFVCVDSNDQESKLGREGIHSYAFKRI
jgi:hypothetical protein